mmetsp:Transcript_23360/g.62769  ORF Transcript_23360/g.62769 Transcript_23360/m.62769 type:complete len:236 (-) Transcript_23360:7168-7875(-)
MDREVDRNRVPVGRVLVDLHVAHVRGVCDELGALDQGLLEHCKVRCGEILHRLETAQHDRRPCLHQVVLGEGWLRGRRRRWGERGHGRGARSRRQRRGARRRDLCGRRRQARRREKGRQRARLRAGGRRRIRLLGSAVHRAAADAHPGRRAFEKVGHVVRVHTQDAVEAIHPHNARRVHIRVVLGQVELDVAVRRDRIGRCKVDLDVSLDAGHCVLRSHYRKHIEEAWLHRVRIW